MKDSIEQMIKELKSDMKIIALQGKGGTGKTQCLQKLIYEIGKNNTITCLYPQNNFKFNELIQNGDPVTKSNNNMVDFIVYGKIENKIVGITTYGDDDDSLIDSFYKLKNYDCDLYICACRTHGQTINLLKELTLTGKLIIHNRWAVNEELFREKTLKYQIKEIYNEILYLLK